MLEEEFTPGAGADLASSPATDSKASQHTGNSTPLLLKVINLSHSGAGLHAVLVVDYYFSNYFETVVKCSNVVITSLAFGVHHEHSTNETRHSLHSQTLVRQRPAVQALFLVLVSRCLGHGSMCGLRAAA